MGPSSVLTYKVAKVFMLLALVMIAMGALVKSRGAVMSKRALDHEVSGLLRVMSRLVQLEILLFASAHLLANGDSSSILVFGTFDFLSFFVMLSMEPKALAGN